MTTNVVIHLPITNTFVGSVCVGLGSEVAGSGPWTWAGSGATGG